MQLVRPLLHTASSSIVDCYMRTPTGIAIFVDEIVFKILHDSCAQENVHARMPPAIWNPRAHADAIYNVNK